MYSTNQTDFFKISANQIWYYNQNEKSLSRDKFSKFGLNSTTIYERVKSLGSGISGIVVLFKPEVMGKCKAVKFSNGNHSPVKPEFEMSLKWPKGAIGLLLRPKAYFKNPYNDFYIMHKYDAAVNAILFRLCIKEKIDAVYQICQGLYILHNLGIAHCDIHLANVFYDKAKNRFDLGDFGCAISVETNKKRFDSGVNKDIRDLKEAIESILIGEEVDVFARIIDGYRQRLNSIEDILKLGFSIKSSWLILDFMNTSSQNIKEILNNFKKIKDSL